MHRRGGVMKEILWRWSCEERKTWQGNIEQNKSPQYTASCRKDYVFFLFVSCAPCFVFLLFFNTNICQRKEESEYSFRLQDEECMYSMMLWLFLEYFLFTAFPAYPSAHWRLPIKSPLNIEAGRFLLPAEFSQNRTTRCRWRANGGMGGRLLLLLLLTLIIKICHNLHLLRINMLVNPLKYANIYTYLLRMTWFDGRERERKRTIANIIFFVFFVFFLIFPLLCVRYLRCTESNLNVPCKTVQGHLPVNKEASQVR